MFHGDIPVANFTISDEAKRGIELIRKVYDAQSSDPAQVVMVGWGRLQSVSESPSESVVVGFYRRSEASNIADAVQHVFGLRVFFFANATDYPKFDGKILDFDDGRGFFLRSA